ncbi:MAG: CBM9 family sugar-binding protein [Bacteroidaceae bacterium]|nr:CBM9 family sugar-binding protein [Bacteroidaceae bacterium]
MKIQNTLLTLLMLITTFSTRAQDYRTGIRIGWDFRTQKYINNGSYGRLKMLSDGRQALVFDQGGVCKIRFKLPTATGFQTATTVASPPAGSSYTNAELLELQDGKLMYACNERINGYGMKIKVIYSQDGGLSWNNEQVIYEVRESEYVENEDLFGIWEPAMIQLPNGDIQLFFASEYRVPNHDQKIVMLRSTCNDDKGLPIWTDTIDVCYTVGYRDGMPVPLVLQNDKGIVFAIEDDGYGGGFQPGIIYTSLEDNWKSGIRYGDSDKRWVAVASGEPRGGGAPYIIQLKTGETVVSTQTNSLADTRGAPWDDMYKNRPFVYIGDESARNFGCYSIPFPFMEEPDQGGVWNSLCQVDDSTIVCVSEIHGHPTRNGLWTVEGHIMHPMTSHQLPVGTSMEDIDWAPLMSDIFIGSQSQANMNVGSCWSDDSLFLRCVVNDKMIRSGAERAPLWDTDGIEFYCDMGNYKTDNIAMGAMKFLVNVDGGTLTSRWSSSGWTDMPASNYHMRHVILREDKQYIISLALPWNRILRKPAAQKFAGYFKLHNNDLYKNKEFIYHEVLSGISEGRSRTWWQISLGDAPDAVQAPEDDADTSEYRWRLDSGGIHYNLQGIATHSLCRGIHIINGRKVTIR